MSMELANAGLKALPRTRRMIRSADRLRETFVHDELKYEAQRYFQNLSRETITSQQRSEDRAADARAGSFKGEMVGGTAAQGAATRGAFSRTISTSPQITERTAKASSRGLHLADWA